MTAEARASKRELHADDIENGYVEVIPTLDGFHHVVIADPEKPGRFVAIAAYQTLARAEAFAAGFRAGFPMGKGRGQGAAAPE